MGSFAFYSARAPILTFPLGGKGQATSPTL